MKNKSILGLLLIMAIALSGSVGFASNLHPEKNKDGPVIAIPVICNGKAGIACEDLPYTVCPAGLSSFKKSCIEKETGYAYALKHTIGCSNGILLCCIINKKSLTNKKISDIDRFTPERWLYRTRSYTRLCIAIPECKKLKAILLNVNSPPDAGLS